MDYRRHGDKSCRIKGRIRRQNTLESIALAIDGEGVKYTGVLSSFGAAAGVMI